MSEYEKIVEKMELMRDWVHEREELEFLVEDDFLDNYIVENVSLQNRIKWLIEREYEAHKQTSFEGWAKRKAR